MKTMGQKIKERRVALGMTQAKLAEIVGVSIRNVSRYETDSTVPPRSSLKSVANALGVSVAYLSDPEIEDENYGRAEEPYVDAVGDQYGAKGARDMMALLQDNVALFAGGDIPQEDKDKFFEAVRAAYVATKQDASKRFGNHKQEV